MKGLLINNGDYPGLKGLNYPIEIECQIHKDYPQDVDSIVQITREELIRIGGNKDSLNRLKLWSFFVDSEVKILEK